MSQLIGTKRKIQCSTHLKNFQIRGADEEKMETYDVYDDTFSEESNKVVGNFKMFRFSRT